MNVVSAFEVLVESRCFCFAKVREAERDLNTAVFDFGTECRGRSTLIVFSEGQNMRPYMEFDGSHSLHGCLRYSTSWVS